MNSSTKTIVAIYVAAAITAAGLGALSARHRCANMLPIEAIAVGAAWPIAGVTVSLVYLFGLESNNKCNAPTVKP